ncbi:MAG: VWA domain-containing protein [Geminicoccaceae bacterium]
MIEFARPWCLLFLPLAWIAWKVLPPWPSPASLPVPPFAARELEAVAQSGKRGLRAPSELVFVALGWIALVIAIAGPISRGAEILQPSGRDLVLAIDLSASMGEPMDPQAGERRRMDVVSDIAGAFIEGRRGDRVALVGFASEAYLIAPPTYDTDAVAGFLDELAIGLAGRRTDLGAAVGMSIRTLEAQPAEARLAVILSDGEGNAGDLAPDTAAALAAEKKIRIHTIGFGAESDAGSSADSDSKSALATIADATGGRHFRARTAADLGEIYREIDRIEPVQAKAADPHFWQRDWTGAALLLAMAALGITLFQAVRRW